MRTVNEVASELKISPATVYGWIASGMLPHFRLGAKGRRGCIRVSDEDFQAFLAQQKQAERPEPIRPPVRKVTPIKLKHLTMPS